MSTNATDLRAQEAQSPSRFAAAINNPGLVATVLLCAIGLLVTAVVALRFPNLGAIIAQSNQF